MAAHGLHVIAMHGIFHKGYMDTHLDTCTMAGKGTHWVTACSTILTKMNEWHPALRSICHWRVWEKDRDMLRDLWRRKKDRPQGSSAFSSPTKDKTKKDMQPMGLWARDPLDIVKRKQWMKSYRYFFVHVFMINLERSTPNSLYGSWNWNNGDNIIVLRHAVPPSFLSPSLLTFFQYVAPSTGLAVHQFRFFCWFTRELYSTASITLLLLHSPFLSPPYWEPVKLDITPWYRMLPQHDGVKKVIDVLGVALIAESEAEESLFLEGKKHIIKVCGRQSVMEWRDGRRKEKTGERCSPR